MEPKDPLRDETYTFRSVDESGDVTETEITAAQALDLAAEKPISYFPDEKLLLMDESGQTTKRESAIPPDEAA